MINVGQITEHQEVVGSDGGHVGKVDHVMGNQIELARMDLSGGLRHHMIPLSWVESIDDKIHLSLTEDEAKNRWTEKGEKPGDHVGLM